MKLFLPAMAGLLLASSLVADPPKDKEKATDRPVSYYKDVRPILQQACQGCHQPARPQGGYVMTSHADLLKAGDSGKQGVTPGKPDGSEVVRQITPVREKAAMPKGRPPLSSAEVALISRWVSEGAKDDTPKSAIDTISEKNPPVYTLPPVLTALDYSPDGALLAVSGYHEVLLHKADGSGLAGRLIGLSERVQSLAFSPDGKSLAVAGGSPGRFGEVQVWDVARKKLKTSASLTFDTLYGVSWSPDGSKIAVGCSDNSVRAIDAETGKQVLFMNTHTDWALGTAFSSDGKHLVSVSRDMSARLTVVDTQRFVDNITTITPGRLKGGLQAVSLRPQAKPSNVTGVDGAPKLYDEVVFAGSDGTPRLYKIHRVKQRTIGDDDNKVREYSAMPGRVFSVRCSRDGTRFAAASSLDGKGELRVYDAASGKVISKLETAALYAAAFRPDGKEVACGGLDGVIRFVHPDTGKVIRELPAVTLRK
jgi:WD40 repeat protein